MAAVLEEKHPCEGFGSGGKFRNAPFRRTTPYDRPPTALRNPSAAAANGGWLSKLVDPAHRLFSSVFRNRLPPPPQSTWTGLTDRQGIPKVAIHQIEQVLEQKTFTRSEIDRLTALLNSRIVDSIPIEKKNQEQKTVPSKPVASPCVFGSRGQSQRNQDSSSPALFSSGVPIFTLVPKARGRSAIHRMAQTPYARIRTTAGLKRRFSVFDDNNAMGSVGGGPIRKVGQKPILSPSGGSGSEAAQEDPSSSCIRKPVQKKHKGSSENGGNAVPRASSEMGLRILEQVGNVGSSKVLDSVHNKDKEDGDLACENRDKAPRIDVLSDTGAEKEESVVNVETKVAVSASPSKSAFKMSAHDYDFVLVKDVDDETNEPVASNFNSLTDAEKSSGVSTASVTLDPKPPPVISENINSRISISPSSVALSSITDDLSTPVATQPAGFTFDKVAPSMSNFGVNNVASTKNEEAGSPLFTLTDKTVDEKVPAVATTSVDVNVGAFSHPKLPESSSCSVSPVIADTASLLPNPLDSDSNKAAENKNVNPNAGGVSFAVPSAISPAPSTTEGTAKLNTESSSQLSPAAAPSVFNNFTSPNSSSGITLTAETSTAVNSIATETAITANSTNSLPIGFGESATSTTNSAPIGFGESATSTTISTPFGGFPTAATSTTNTAPTGFGGSSPLFPGSSNASYSISTFPFPSPASKSVPSVPAFGTPNPAFSFTSSGSTDQTSTTLTFPVLGQQPVFGQQIVPLGNPFQFASQQNVANPQINTSPFQGFGSFDEGLGSGFSFGSSGGDDKSKRRHIKPKPTRSRKK